MFRHHPVLQAELSDLAADRLKERGRAFREVFLSRLGLLLRGTVAAPPEKFGETLADEHIQGGALLLTKVHAASGCRAASWLLWLVPKMCTYSHHMISSIPHRQQAGGRLGYL